MKFHKIVLGILLLLLVIIGYIWFAGWSTREKNEQTAFEKPASTATAPTKTSLSVSDRISSVHKANIVPPPLPNASEDAKWTWWREMGAKDHFFEYKMPISFFGRVIDDSNNPVAGAMIEFSWVNLSKDGGETRRTTSDIEGRFALEGAIGKSLVVQITKDGYKNFASKNRGSFEYAMFADPKYYVPDRAHPVIFVLRKNREAEPLIVLKNREAELHPGQPKAFIIGPKEVSIVIERLPSGAPNSKLWNARVTVPDGGLAVATDEFPYRAPQSGYKDELIIDNTTPKPHNWIGDEGALIYVKTKQGYARVIVHYVPNMPWVYVDSYFNPNPESRNLEYDPAKQIAIKP